MTVEECIANPYVGPRTFDYEDRGLFFGREREARDLLARVVSERLLLFYAQSGAGKSSLLNTRLIPQLQEEKQFVVLPVGRVGGELPSGIDQVDNIYAFNLMLRMHAGDDPGQFAHVTLSDFLGRLVRRTVTDERGQERKAWLYDASLPGATPGASARRYALIIDQFEEIITTHPGRWREREEFFRQLDAAMQDDSNLWVVLTMREDYVAALDPYAPLMADRLRARFYMERMGPEAALDAIRKPAECGGRPFAAGVAESLQNDLSQVRVPGQEDSVPGQYVEPVQLQVVCYQLWENIKASPPGPITAADLREAGDVNRALVTFYEDTLRAVLAERPVQRTGINERQLRAWFDRELITEQKTRDLLRQGEECTGSMPNPVVDELQRRFLVRSETRSGDTRIELAHDRLVEPIRASNEAWFISNQSALERQAAIWRDGGKPPDRLLLVGDDLVEAEQWAETHERELDPIEKEFIAASKAARDEVERALEAERDAARQRQLEAAQALAESERVRADEQSLAADKLRRESRRTRTGLAAALVFAFLALFGLGVAINSRQGEQDAKIALATEAANARAAANEAAAAAVTAQAAATAEATAAADARAKEALAASAAADARAQATEAARKSAQASSSRLATLAGVKSQGDSVDVALLLAAQALKTADTQDARDAVVDALRAWPGLGIFLHGHDVRVGSLAFNQDGETLVSGDDAGRLVAWTQTEASQPISTTIETGLGPIQAVAAHTYTSALAAGTSDGTIEIYEGGQRTPARLNGHVGWINGLAFSPDGRFLASVSEDGKALLWPVASRATSITLESGGGAVTALAFSPNRAAPPLLATGGVGGRVTLWTNLEERPVHQDLATNALVTAPTSLAFDGDGARLAIGFDDGRFAVWDVKGEFLLFTPMDAGDASVESLAFDPVDDALAVLLGDGTLKRYSLKDLESGPEEIPSPTHPAVATASAALRPDGRTWAIGLDRGSIMRGRTGEPAELDSGAPVEVLIEQACRIANRNLYEPEWKEFMGDEPYGATCPAASAEASQGS